MKTTGFCEKCKTPLEGRSRYCTEHERKCEVRDCGRPHKSRGLCEAHYERSQRGAEMSSPIGESLRPRAPARECEFEGCRDSAYGRLPYCNGHYQQSRRGEELRPKRFVKRNTNYMCAIPGCIKRGLGNHLCPQHSGRAIKYSLSVVQLIMLMEQSGCDICGGVSSDGRSLHVDHDHSCCDGDFSCGECIRGMLCQGCNTSLGGFGDSVDTMRTAIDYLEGNRRNQHERHPEHTPSLQH